MGKVLGVVVNNYPYGHGEPFLHDEIIELSKVFDRVILFIPSASHIIKQQKPLFELPKNVTVQPIDNTYSFFQKITSIFHIGPFYLFSKIREEKKIIRRSFSWSMIKVLMAYLVKERSFRKKLWKEVKKRSLMPKDMVLYSYWFTEYTYSLYALKKQHPDLKVYTRTHGWDVYLERHKPAYLPFRKPIIETLDMVFTVSDHARKYLTDKFEIDPGHIETNKLGVTGFPLNPLKYKINHINILSIAFIHPIKNIELLIESLCNVNESIQITWFHIGDGGSYANHIRELAKTKLSSKKNIIYQFRGILSNNEIRDFVALQSIDLFVNTSYDEGLPVSMMEATSAGIPIIGPDVGGISEIIDHGKNGFLLSKKPTPEEISEQILKYSLLNEEDISTLRKNAYLTWENNFNAKKNHGNFALKLRGEKEYLCCTKCILDSNDHPGMVLNEKGICDICSTYDKYSDKLIPMGEKRKAALAKMLNEVKTKGKNKPYDCLIGISGGVDSTYLAYLAKSWGLRPLVLHVDTGWNSTIAVQNIKNTIEMLGFEFYTHVIDWNEMKDLQIAFLKASVVDGDLPVDNAIMASTYDIAKKFRIKHILTGENIATEGWLPPNFNHNKNDVLNILDIHGKFGKVKLKTFPYIGFLDIFISKKIYGIKTHSPLNYIEYNQSVAKRDIQEKLDWRDYGSKHFENLFTRFTQGYILPRKFKVNKQKAHLSTLICSGQISKEEAVREMNKAVYNESLLNEDKAYFIKKLNLSADEFESILAEEPLPHTYYKSIINTFKKLRPMLKLMRKFGLLR